jgi:hypothetical protein
MAYPASWRLLRAQHYCGRHRRGVPRALRKAFASLNNEIKVHVEHMLHFDSAVSISR